MKRVQLRDELADYAHDAWSEWMRYLFSLCERDIYGRYIIPTYYVARWERQSKTDRSNLPPEEQDSDFREANTMMSIMDRVFDRGYDMKQQKMSIYDLVDEHNLLFAQLKPVSSDTSGGTTLKLRQANGGFIEVFLRREEVVSLSRMFDDYIMDHYYSVPDEDLL